MKDDQHRGTDLVCLDKTTYIRQCIKMGIVIIHRRRGGKRERERVKERERASPDFVLL